MRSDHGYSLLQAQRISLYNFTITRLGWFQSIQINNKSRNFFLKILSDFTMVSKTFYQATILKMYTQRNLKQFF